MVFAEIFMFLVFALAAAYVVRVAVKKWRRAGVVGKMTEIEDVEETAEAVRQFKKDHPKPDAAAKTVEDFQNRGR